MASTTTAKLRAELAAAQETIKSLYEHVNDDGTKWRQAQMRYVVTQAEHDISPYRELVHELDHAINPDDTDAARLSDEWSRGVDEFVQQVVDKPEGQRTDVIIMTAVATATGGDDAKCKAAEQRLLHHGRTDQMPRFSTQDGDPLAQWLANKFQQRREQRDQGGKHAAPRRERRFGNLI